MVGQVSNTLILSGVVDDYTPFKPFFRVIPLRKFGICLFIYETTAQAKLKFEELKDFYSLHYYLYTDLNWFSGDEIHPTEFLKLPSTEKNFLLSPPGEPPLGWTQNSEAEPSSGGFTISEEEGRNHFIRTRSYSDLVNFKLDPNEVDVNDEHLQEIVTFTNSGDAVNLPLIVIDHVDGDTLNRSSKKIPHTQMPPQFRTN